MYNFLFSERLNEILGKVSKKNKSLYNQIIKKVEEIVNSADVEHYKNLRHDLKAYKRVQIGHFVLVFRFDKTTNMIYFEDFDHHDNIYKKRF